MLGEPEMSNFYRVAFFCHGCGLENFFTYHCGNEDILVAVRQAANFDCPSGCDPHIEDFELTSLQEVAWQAAVEAVGAVFH